MIFNSAVVTNYEVYKYEDISSEAGINESVVLNSYPNPFSDQITIEYAIKKSELVSITINDNCGRPLYKLQNNAPHDAGSYKVKLSGIDLPSGLYYCTLQTESEYLTKEIVVIK
ncbi:MAG: T9SS C-terminal target domain-containing protein [Cytophagales bacterium]|nr:MAG: T9SS C-terminal target domain-containing protein [Cytophagales bacterium]